MSDSAKDGPEGEELAPWFAIHIRSRHEKLVAADLERSGTEVFLPTIVKWSRWKDRKKEWFVSFDARRERPVK